jgi:hypothetical protein
MASKQHGAHWVAIVLLAASVCALGISALIIWLVNPGGPAARVLPRAIWMATISVSQMLETLATKA